MPATELTLDELHSMATSEAASNEANAVETVPAGWYNFQATRTYSFKDETESFGDGRVNPNYNRIMTLFSGTLTTDTGERVGQITLRTSHEEKRDEKGKLDKESTLFYQMADALDRKGQSVGSVVEAAKAFPVRASVNETFRKVDGANREFKYARTEEERVQYVREGFIPSNKVRKVEKVR